MTLALIALVAVAITELALPLLWRLRRGLAAVLIVAVLASSTWLVIARFNLASVLIAIISAYRAINLWRVVKNRLETHRLRTVTSRASLYLLDMQIAVVLGWIAALRWSITPLQGWYVLSVVLLAMSAVLFASTYRHLIKTRSELIAANLADRDLPTLTVAIPARNETIALRECLESLLTNKYPKLEVLVLDDCSANKHVSEVVRQFAHDGVTFLEGTAPPDQWLAKNWAYEQLAERANGEYIVFCGVDARFRPDSLRALVTTLLTKHKTMLSIVPNNAQTASLVQPMRYAWELSLPRRLLERPPVLSTCWIIARQTLHKAGGFAADTRKVVPESYFARYTAGHADGYGFIRTDSWLSISSNKAISEQRTTTIRVRYPQLHRRLELVAFISLVELIGLIAPYVFLLFAIHRHRPVLVLLNTLSVCLLVAGYACITKLAYNKWFWRSLVLVPFAAVSDTYLTNLSLWRYEFGEVIWKGRNVCLPVMETLNKLPSMK